ncbi:Transcription factor mbp1 [Coemansia guatemalensis]|uniref:Transcription factor mbp1 n=1 Tax=Coemansia guatemalensis TaxID=2761395 RepID=A0A9W8HRJ9_9FUNG|nr:Transcription factor mbp1 [Coemansia guatemalensis]
MANQANGTRSQVWSASYAGVEVFQQLYNGTAVMRRRKDSFVNATQILKCAQYDKPHRTRFLEREIHTGIHEKVQGGYGKYQGTWVPLDRAIGLSRRLNVFEALRSLLEYNPAGGTTPPTAPRSLESMHKRKSRNEAGSATKRRTSRGAAAAAARMGRPGSINTILNTNGIRSPECTPHMQQPVVSGEAWVQADTANYTPTYVHRTGPPARSTLAQMTPDTPGSGRTGGVATVGSPTYMRGNPTHLSQARGSCRAAYQTEGRVLTVSNGRTPLLVGGGDDGGGGGGWALRDISNTYQTPSAHTGHAKASASLLTPPPSTTRRGGLPRSAHPETPNVVLGSPAPRGGMAEMHANSNGVWTPNAPPVCPQSAPGSTHASPEGTVSARSEQTSPPDDSEVGRRFEEFVGRPRTAGLMPLELERYVTRSASFDANADVGPHGPALHAAVANGHWDVVQLLVRRGVDTARGNSQGLTPLMLAVSSTRAWHQRSARVLEWLLDTLAAALIKRDRKGRTIVHWVALGPPEDRDIWPEASLHYARLLIRKLVQCGHSEIFAWQDYDGKRADQLALDSGLSGMLALARLLEKQCHANPHPTEPATEDRQPPSRPLESVPESVSEPTPESASAPKSAPDSYARFASQASKIIRQSAADMRKDHLQAQRVIDEDTKYAAKLLLELRSERDSAQQTAKDCQEVAEECIHQQSREHELRRRVECAVNLQMSTHATTAAIAQHQYQHSLPRRSGGGSNKDVEELRAEYQMLRQSAASYEHHSQLLAAEYAELASIVKPWTRSPGMTALSGAASEKSEEDLDDAMSVLGKLLGTASAHYRPKRPLYNDPETADVNAIKAALETEEHRLRKLESVVSAACGDLPLDRVRSVVGPVLSLLNNGNAL